MSCELPTDGHSARRGAGLSRRHSATSYTETIFPRPFSSLLPAPDLAFVAHCIKIAHGVLLLLDLIGEVGSDAPVLHDAHGHLLRPGKVAGLLLRLTAAVTNFVRCAGS